MAPSSAFGGQRGQATIEYLYVVPILLMLLLASLQFVFIYEAKLTLNYATFVGTRAGALHNGAMAAIQDGLTAGMAPLFAHGETQQALKDARTVARTELGNTNLTTISILNPTSSALSAFGSEIPNDNLMYRSTDDNGGMNVQDANLLKVRVTYCVRLVVPLINRMIHLLAPAPATAIGPLDTYSGGSISATDMLKVDATTGGACNDPNNAYPYRIRVSSEAVVRMQSPFRHPVSWHIP